MSAPILDLERLLHPISPEAATGPELSEDQKFDLVGNEASDARRAEREVVSLLGQTAGVNEAELTANDRELYSRSKENLTSKTREARKLWQKVSAAAQRLLSEQSKDMQVVSWLLEAQARLDQFAGIRDSFHLVRELVARYADTLHPQVSVNGQRQLSLDDLVRLLDDDEGLAGPLNGAALTVDVEGGALTGIDFVDAYERRESEVSAARLTLLRKRFEEAQRSAPRDFVDTLRSDVTLAKAEFELALSLLKERLGSAAPTGKGVAETLERSLERVTKLYPVADDGNASGAGGVQLSASPLETARGEIATREQAFQALGRVAQFFRRTEPHSPVSYALEQVVRWGKMSLPELLTELISESAVRDELFRRTGIPQHKSNDSN